MTIKKLTITTEELVLAVQEYLKTRGLNLPVENVSKTYLGDREWEVELKSLLEPTAVPDIIVKEKIDIEKS